VGKLKESYLVRAVEEYSKRIGRYATLERIWVPEEPFADSASPARRDEIRAAEGRRLLARTRPSSFLILCDLEGQEMSSEEFSRFLSELGVGGASDLTFLIGGPLGVSPEVRERSRARISFSRMTFPHQLMQVMLLEQIYRAFKISRGEPYHY
ncbi:MAG: 23S rRNA (pseudouridine(1915)-N(3))-methyltransferase RlmH, partial [Firmicutes bacterium]|nr:23S rRNA (pseudouridine(1915)-N(3))-methyltransferase RlmH [Bacillota bacterium]